MATNCRLAATHQLADSILNSERFLNSCNYEASTNNLLSDESGLAIQSIVFSEIEIDALEYLYARQILRDSRLISCLRILFSLTAEVPVYRAKEYALAHNPLFNLIERKRDFLQRTVPDTVQ